MVTHKQIRNQNPPRQRRKVNRSQSPVYFNKILNVLPSLLKRLHNPQNVIQQQPAPYNKAHHPNKPREIVVFIN